MDNQKLITRGLIGAGIVVLAYQLYKWTTKPKDTTDTSFPPPKPPQSTTLGIKSNAEGKTTKASDVFVNTIQRRDDYIKRKGYQAGERRYEKGYGKVFEFRNDDKGARWIMLADKNQPKPMEWFRLNGKWWWSNWANKLVDYNGKILNYAQDMGYLKLPQDGKPTTSKPSF